MIELAHLAHVFINVWNVLAPKLTIHRKMFNSVRKKKTITGVIQALLTILFGFVDIYIDAYSSLLLANVLFISFMQLYLLEVYFPQQTIQFLFIFPISI